MSGYIPQGLGVLMCITGMCTCTLLFIPKQHLDAAKLASQECAFCQLKVTQCFGCFHFEVARVQGFCCHHYLI